MFKPNRIIKSIGIKISVAKVRKGEAGDQILFPRVQQGIKLCQRNSKVHQKEQKECLHQSRILKKYEGPKVLSKNIKILQKL